MLKSERSARAFPRNAQEAEKFVVTFESEDSQGSFFDRFGDEDELDLDDDDDFEDDDDDLEEDAYGMDDPGNLPPLPEGIPPEALPMLLGLLKKLGKFPALKDVDPRMLAQLLATMSPDDLYGDESGDRFPSLRDAEGRTARAANAASERGTRVAPLRNTDDAVRNGHEKPANSILGRGIEGAGHRPDATDEQIHAAYLEQVRQHPPDRDPDQFECIRDAFEQLRDPSVRASGACGPGPKFAIGQPAGRVEARRGMRRPRAVTRRAEGETNLSDDEAVLSVAASNDEGQTLMPPPQADAAAPSRVPSNRCRPPQRSGRNCATGWCGSSSGGWTACSATRRRRRAFLRASGRGAVADDGTSLPSADADLLRFSPH